MTSLRSHSKQEGESGFGSNLIYCKPFISTDLYIPRMLKGKDKKSCVCFPTRSFIRTQTQSDWVQDVSLSSPLWLCHIHMPTLHGNIPKHITQVLVRLSGKESACQAGNASDTGSIPGSASWRRKQQPTPGFLPRKSHGPRGLEGYSPLGHKELNITEHTHNIH